MLQQFIALVVIGFFVARLFFQKKNNKISKNEFLLWLMFWLIAGAAVLFLKKIDLFVANLGFSSSGIDVLLYVGIIILFSFVFKLRLRIERMEQNTTKLVRELSLMKEKYEKR